MFGVLIDMWVMARPVQLLAVTLVYALGVLIARADGLTVSVDGTLLGWLALMPAAMSIHYANEYADYETDRLTTRTPFSGGSGVLPRGRLPRRAAVWGMVITAILSMVIALGGSLNQTAFGILLAGLFFGWMYSLPPLKLAWRGWGELDNALLGGLALHLYGYAVVSARLSLTVTIIAVPFTLLVYLNLLATTWPDRHADAKVGKLTLATRLPVPVLRRLHAVVALIALITVSANHAHFIPEIVCWLMLPVIPLVIWAGLRYTKVETPLASVRSMVVMLLLNLYGWWMV